MNSPREAGAASPPEAFNFARHLLEQNASRGAKVAYLDDGGSMSYEELERRIRKFGDALQHLGLHREERILLLAFDTNDWPVAFLGALYAGVVPIPINTLSTISDLTYILEHSGAQGAIVSAALLNGFKSAASQVGSRFSSARHSHWDC